MSRFGDGQPRAAASLGKMLDITRHRITKGEPTALIMIVGLKNTGGPVQGDDSFYYFGCATLGVSLRPGISKCWLVIHPDFWK